MKKTLIALMALAGVACANSTEYTNDDFNTWYATAISATSYVAGNDYTLTFTLGEWPSVTGTQASIGHRSGFLIQLTENWGLYTQAGEYLAFDDSTTNDRPSLTTSDKTYTSTNTTKATGSLAQGTEGWFYKNNGTNQQNDTTFVISRSEGVDTITISKGDNTIADFTITGDSPLNAAFYSIPDIYDSDSGADAGKSFGFNVKSATFAANGTTSTLTVPEPATATLSLLALAGLAARRRRK